MNNSTIGDNILKLRKEKGITQETLAKEIGITSQAVSKWETGGAPDIETIVLVADYFEVSIDQLFGRSMNDYGNIDKLIAESIVNLPSEQRLEKAFEYCWTIEKSIMGDDNTDENTLDEILKKDAKQKYSQVLHDNGFTSMSLSNDLQYFLLMPEPGSGWQEELGFKKDYLSLFNFLGDKNVLKTLYFLFGRDNKPFTPRLIEDNIGLTNTETRDILDRLKKYKLITTSEIELDDEVIEVYNFYQNPAFIVVLAFCNSIIDKPNNFYYYNGGRDKPYFSKSN